MGVAYSVGDVLMVWFASPLQLGQAIFGLVVQQSRPPLHLFVQWSPEKYTEAIKKHCQARHFRKKHKNSFFTDKNVINSLFSNLNDNLKAANNWEFITVKQTKQHINLCNLEDFEEDEPEVENDLPVLSDQSLLLDDHHLKTLVAHLPQRTQGYKWNLVYSTAIHGSSLKTLYRNMAGLDSPVLLVIKDMHKKVFGAFSSDPFRISKYCYGTGETFLFTFSPDFQQYKWSGENSYFVSGDLGSLQIGGGGGGFALWLDADLYHGASFSCPTFHNATLSTHEDFIVQDAEVWTVQN